MKKIFFSVLVVIVSVLTVSAQWMPVNSPTEESLQTALQAGDQLFVFGYNSAFSTNNGGQSWNTLPVTGNITCSELINSSIFIAGDHGLAKVSHDFGLTWNDIPLLSGNNNIMDIVQVNNKLVFLPYKAQVATMVDLNDLTKIDTLQLPYAFSDPYYVEFGFAWGNTLFLAVGEHVKATQGPIKGLYFTNNLGVTWEENTAFQSQSFGRLFADAYVYEDNIYMVVNGSPGFGTYILISEDGGASWNEYNHVDDSYFFYSIFLNQYGTVFAAGGELANNQIVGVALENDQPMEISDSRLRYITGNGEQLIVVGDNGAIYMQSTTSIEESSYSNLTVYPNPCMNELTVSFENNNATFMTVNIYSISGQLIKSIQTNSDVTIDMSDQPSGMYSLQINGRAAQKIIKM